MLRSTRALSAAFGCCSLLSASRPALALDPPLRLDASPLVGSATSTPGWVSLLLRVENRSAAKLEGVIGLESPRRYGGTEGLKAEVPFALAPGARASIELPTRSLQSATEVVARDAEGHELARSPLAERDRADIGILSLASPSRLAPALRGALAPARRPTRYGSLGATINATSAEQNPATGDPLLPRFPAAYSALSLVLAPSRTLARLGDSERLALSDWVLSGGALAISIERPEDVRAPLVTAMLGEAPTEVDAPDRMREPAVFWTPPDDANTGPRLRRLEFGPSGELSPLLRSYAGKNLRPTPWGAAASYGLGELHLLAFDPEAPGTLTDTWARHKLIDLARHAYDRRSHIALGHGMLPMNPTPTDSVRKNLDPNQASRWTIVVSALLLLAYAGLAGPLSFYLAQRRGRPLLALARLPLWSAVTFAFIVAIGIFGKGLSGKSRRLSFVEAGAGMTRASAVRFRGFYAASSEELVLRPERRENVLDVAGEGDVARTLVVDRDGPRLAGVRTRPWQTLMVREDGFMDLEGGVSVVDDGGQVAIKNRVGRALLGVVLRLPKGEVRYFARLENGAGAKATDGRPLLSLPGASYPGAPSLQLSSRNFSEDLDRDAPGLGQAWLALEPTIPYDCDFWSDDVPVLIAAIEGGEGRLSDSGLNVDYDRLLLRVVGTGGQP